ncbi:unnamed protein product [Sphenostylis stenocarpa]|uniref:Transmembrane protein n=1 Tax=Sphenostylis stenocarpa TaxID=92480 RepID=A0AA87B6Q3_9FABA|nr:unnamed protein product [Sphenostylis stenocarpa]
MATRLEGIVNAVVEPRKILVRVLILSFLFSFGFLSFLDDSSEHGLLPNHIQSRKRKMNGQGEKLQMMYLDNQLQKPPKMKQNDHPIDIGAGVSVCQ